MKKWLAIFFVSALLLPLPAAPGTRRPSTMPQTSFTQALQAHLQAIRARDLPALAATVTLDEDIVLIYPNGACVEGRQAYLAEMKEWFADPGWRLNCEIKKIVETGELSSALLLCGYDEKHPGQPPRHLDYFLFLVFRNQQGHWRLVHDQNTVTHLQ